MYPATFDYYRAKNLPDAIRLLGAHADAKVLAGGHSLIPMMKLRLATPPALVDIGRVPELRFIKVEEAGVSVGALTTHAEIAASAVLKERCRLLPEVAAMIADPQVRNKGTIGGNIAHADPASDFPAALLALDAVVQLTGPAGSREVKAANFFLDLMTTDLQPNEILTRVVVRGLGKGTGSAYLKFEHPASGYAVCGAAAVVSIGGDGRCTGARLCFNGITSTPHDATAVAKSLLGTTLDDAAIVAALDGNLTVQEPLDDIHFSGEYRVVLARVYGSRALKLARDRARA
jgi:carbon-monoxide dehydrogenase medium subunit